jgi:hypothetical protein
VRHVRAPIVAKLLLLLALLSASGCYAIKYRVDNRQGRTFENQNTNLYFFFGLAPSEGPFKEENLCHGKELIMAETSVRPANVLDALLSARLTGTSSVKTVCSESPSPSDKKPEKKTPNSTH